MREQLREAVAHRISTNEGLSRPWPDRRGVNAVAGNEFRQCGQIRSPPGTHDFAYFLVLCGTSAREKLEFWSWSLDPAAVYTSKAHPHGMRELIWVMTGTLTLATGGEDTAASAGDCIIFEADQQHTYRNSGQQACKFTMIVQLGVA